jgi:hypothetical protein
MQEKYKSNNSNVKNVANLPAGTREMMEDFLDTKKKINSSYNRENKNNQTPNKLNRSNYDTVNLPDSTANYNLNNSISKLISNNRLNDSNASIATSRSLGTNRSVKSTGNTNASANYGNIGKNKIKNKIEDFVYFYNF